MNIAATTLIDKLIEEKDFLKKAQLVDSLRRDSCLSVKEIAENVHKHPSYISHLHRLLTLPPLVIDGYYAKQVSLSHLVILSRLDDTHEMEQVYMEILAKGLTSTQTEELIRLKKFQISGEIERVPSEELSQLVTSVQTSIKDIKVKVVQTRIKGKIVIELKGNNKETTAFIRKILKGLAQETPVQEGKKGTVLMTLE